MFQYYNNILCVQGRWLYGEGNIVSSNNYKRLTQRGWLQVIRRGGNGRTALVSYDSIPERFKKVIVDNFGDPRETTKQSRLKDNLVTDIKAAEYFRGYTLDNGSALPEKNINEYLANATILNALHKILNETRSVRGKVKNVWNNSAEVIQKLPKHTYPHSLPKNVQSLKRKYAAYLAKETTKKIPRIGYESLIHAGFCNNNTKKIKGNIADWWLAMYSLPNKMKVPMIMEQYEAIKEEKDFPSLTTEVVNKWLHQPEIERQWVLGRHGKEEWKNRFGHYIKRKRDNWFPNTYWAIDGSKIDWVHYEDNTLGMAGKLKIDPVVDVFSEKIIGWSFSETEDHVDHFTALKMAVNNTSARPYLFTYDNQSGHKMARMQELYSGIIAKNGGVHYPNKARSHNSPVENIFNRLQQQVLNVMWWSDKQSPTVRTMDNKPNWDFIKANKHLLKTKEDLIKAWEMCVKIWNEAPHPKFKEMSRNEVFAMEAPMREEVSLLDNIDLFWIFNKGRRYDRGGIELEVAKVKYQYEVLGNDNRIDLEFRRKYVGKKLLVKYDPDHLNDFVCQYDVDEQGNKVFVANAQPKRAHESILVLIQEGDKSAWQEDYSVTDLELDRDTHALNKLRERTGITPEKLIEQQSLMLKMGGDLPKEERLKLDSELVYVDTTDRM